MSQDLEPIRVLIVDDQAMVVSALRQMLSDVPNLEFFGCTDPQQAIRQANEIQPTVILQDLVMPEIDGLMLVKFFRANPATADTPMIVLSSKEEAITKAEAFTNGANDYLVKLPDKLELVARIRYHSQAYNNLIQRNAAYEEIAKAKKHLADEFAAADKYVRSLLAKPWTGGEHPAIQSMDWRFVPTAQMGGDALGYHILDDEHLALYVLDVTGHGLASALLGTTVLNVIRTGTLPNTDFKEPGQVLFGLNEAFPCEKHGEKFFTVWYGVYHTSTRQLRWSGAGHPSPFLFAGNEPPRTPPKQLESQGPMIGMMPWPEFEVSETIVPPGSRLFLYSDGAHEIHKTDGTDWTWPDFVQTFTDFVNDRPTTVMDDLHTLIIEMNGSPVLDDDFSILDIQYV
ncbi:MAG: SpoIIE family protein phosphatase [Fimbriiglobus sp.]